MRQDAYYRHSGSIPQSALAAMLGIGGATAGVLGFLYPYATHYCPFIYINFFLTLALGAGVGLAVDFGARIGRLRNNLALSLVSALVAVATLYWTNAVYVRVVTEDAYLPLAVGDLWDSLLQINEIGVWSIFGVEAKGILLTLVWVVESAMIAGLIVLIPHTNTGQLAFCEACRRWAERVEVLEPFPFPKKLAELVESLENGDFARLATIRRVRDPGTRFMRVQFTSCAACEQMHLLTLEVVTRGADDEGNAVENTDEVVRNLVLEPPIYDAIRELDRVPIDEATAAVEDAGDTGDAGPAQDPEDGTA